MNVKSQYVPWQPSQRYPDPAIEIVDQSFDKYRIKQSSVERIAHGFRWAEGPVWFALIPLGAILAYVDVARGRENAPVQPRAREIVGSNPQFC